MALKMMGDDGTGLPSDAIAALEYAVDKGVRVSNNSWGYTTYTPVEEADHYALYDAIQAAGLAGHLFVAAGGNELTDTDVTPHYPSSFDLDNIVSVAATDNTDHLAWFSSYGPTTVDLAAPGDYVFSTYKLWGGVLDDYGWLSGTSMATPQVAGVAGLLLGLQPGWTYGQVRDRILATARPLAALSGMTATGGMLNIQAALDGVPDDSGGGGGDGGGGGGGGDGTPETPVTFVGIDQGDGSVALTWTDVTDPLRPGAPEGAQAARLDH